MERKIVKNNTRLAIQKSREIEKEYLTKEYRYAKLSQMPFSLLQEEEYYNLRRELDILGEVWERSIEQLFKQLKVDGSWKAKLKYYWWRRKFRQYGEIFGCH